MLTIANVSKSYGPRTLFSEVSLNIARTEAQLAYGSAAVEALKQAADAELNVSDTEYQVSSAEPPSAGT